MVQYVITFESTKDVFKMEKELHKNKIPFEFIPTPRKISAECGFSILLECVCDIDKEKYTYDKIYTKKKENGDINYELYS